MDINWREQTKPFLWNVLIMLFTFDLCLFTLIAIVLNILILYHHMVHHIRLPCGKMYK